MPSRPRNVPMVCPDAVSGYMRNGHSIDLLILNDVMAIHDAHLRELKALVEIEKEEWARKMQRLLRRACHVTNRARDRGIPMKPRFMKLSSAITTALSPKDSSSMRRK